jgi:hypothetical protein
MVALNTRERIEVGVTDEGTGLGRRDPKQSAPREATTRGDRVAPAVNDLDPYGIADVYLPWGLKTSSKYSTSRSGRTPPTSSTDVDAVRDPPHSSE